MDDWRETLPDGVRTLLSRVHALVERGDHQVAPSPLRTLIEITGRDMLGPERRSFRKTLLDLHRVGLFGTQDLHRLMEVLAAANDVIHRGRQFDLEAVEHMVLCVERLLQSAYVLRRPHPELRNG